MLTRIYGLAFSTKAELDAFITQREEAIKRDHRKIGKELDLFISQIGRCRTSLYTPKGTIMRDELDAYLREGLHEKFWLSASHYPAYHQDRALRESGHWENSRRTLSHENARGSRTSSRLNR